MAVFHRLACDSTTPSHQLNQPQHTPSPSIAIPKLMNRCPHPFRTPCRIRFDQPLPLPSFPLSMALICPSSAQSVKRCCQSGASSASTTSTSSSLPSSALRAPSFPGADVSEEIESSAPQGRWGEFTLILGFRRDNIEEKLGGRLGYHECSVLSPCSSTVTPLSLH